MLEEVVRGLSPIWGCRVREKGEDPGAVGVYLVVDWICRACVENRPYFDCREDREEFAHKRCGLRDRGVPLDAYGDGRWLESHEAMRLDDHGPREVAVGSCMKEGRNGTSVGSIRGVCEVGSCPEGLLVLM